jgi:5-methylcytosine-specific restriction protein A
MPLLHICAYPGCTAAVPVGQKYCDRHAGKAADAEAARNRFAARRRQLEKGTSAARGYGHRWRKLRAWYLAGHPFCEECAKRHIVTKATDVDHIVPHRGDPALFWDADNLQALCHACHSRKTAAEDGGYGNARVIKPK